MKFPRHDPYSLVLPWLYEENSIPQEKIPSALQSMKQKVIEARKKFGDSMKTEIPYNDKFYRGSYFIAYFPYNIEPVYYALENANLNFNKYPGPKITAAFFGGGPCPELLGFCSFLRKHAPHVRHIRAIIFDKEAQWEKAHKALNDKLIPYYWKPPLTFELNHENCDIAECMARLCSCKDVLSGIDILIAQNILTEVYKDKKKSLDAFAWILETSSCKIAAFVDNMNNNIFDLMKEISHTLFGKRLIANRQMPTQNEKTPNFSLPSILIDNVFDSSDGLIPKNKVKFNSMVLDIIR